jgi:hypothetical protein
MTCAHKRVSCALWRAYKPLRYLRIIEAAVEAGFGSSLQREEQKATVAKTKRQQPIIPDRQDIEAVEEELGPLGPNPTDAESAKRWRLYQARKLVRLCEQGKLPLSLMDKIRRS